MDEVSEAAEIFAKHCLTCEVCGLPDESLCAEGVLMVHNFQSALHASTLHFKRDVN